MRKSLINSLTIIMVAHIIIPGQSLRSTQVPLFSSKPDGQKQPRTQIRIHGLGEGCAQVSGQADPQSLWIMPLGQAGARVVLTGGGGGVDTVKDKCEVVFCL